MLHSHQRATVNVREVHSCDSNQTAQQTRDWLLTTSSHVFSFNAWYTDNNLLRVLQSLLQGLYLFVAHVQHGPTLRFDHVNLIFVRLHLTLERVVFLPQGLVARRTPSSFPW